MKAFVRTTSLIAVGTMAIGLVPSADARERGARPRRESSQQQRRIQSGDDAPPGVLRRSPTAAPRAVQPGAVYAPGYSSGYVSASPYTSVGVGSGGGISIGGGLGSSGSGSVMDSVINGAALGGVGGPIGLAVGAGIGLLHGLWAKNRRDKQSQVETARQQEIDRQIEREIANRPHGGEEQGVRIVKDHLADEPVRTAATGGDRMVASVPAEPAPTVKKTPARDAVDPDGFKAVYEGDRVVRRERVGPDGKPEVVLHYDGNGALVRRQESTRADGRMDTTLFYGAGGKLERKEADTDGDGTTDVVARYDGLGNLAQMETLEGTTRTRRHFDAGGTVTREDQLGAKGDVVASAFYDNGRLVRRELYEIDESAFKRAPLVSAQTPEAKP